MAEDNLDDLLARNAAWAQSIKNSEPDFFEKLAHQQSPQYLWIGCSDSRVSANQIVGLMPGEVFVHRNVANLVVQSDLNCLSVLQFAVDILKVRSVIVCGHYGCSGIHAVLHKRKIGLVDNWLRVVQERHERRHELFDQLDQERHWDALCEMNVADQVRSVASTTIVQEAWERGQILNIYGWIYGLQDGLLRPLISGVGSNRELEIKFDAAREALKKRYS